MFYSEPTDLAVIACPGGEAFADAVIKHLKHIYKHRFSLKSDCINKRYQIEKNDLIQKIILQTANLKPKSTNQFAESRFIFFRM